MEQFHEQPDRPVKRRRRKRTQFEIFKETYLPAAIVCAALLLIIIFIIGSISHAVQRNNLAASKQEDQAQTMLDEQQALRKQVDAALVEADILAVHYGYDEAIAVLDALPEATHNYQDVTAKRAELVSLKQALVLWEDNTQVLNLSFQLLIADSQRAFQDTTFGSSYKDNFITTSEFTRILQQLYENNYILVSLDDIIATTPLGDGSNVYEGKQLFLPAGKKPLILTQTNVNYNTYMIDSDGDKLPDKGGDGFASRLVIDDNNMLSCEIVHADGTVDTGDYDLVPILESFIATHPDFSYKGARAILAVTGYDGLFGYRTNAAAKTHFGATYCEQEQRTVSEIIKKLRDYGYEIACYTYGNTAYGTSDLSKINEELEKWRTEVVQLLGECDVIAFAKNNDISNTSTLYSGDKFNALYDAGFRYYLGFCSDGNPWSVCTDTYMRQGRILVSGANLKNHADWFEGILDPSAILDSSRNSG